MVDMRLYVLFLAFGCVYGVPIHAYHGIVADTTTRTEEGKFYFYNTDYCFIRNCSGNNVDSPYGIVTFPSRYYHSKYDKIAFDLHENEYVELVMTTPGQAMYYSLTLYLMDRLHAADAEPRITTASLNDTLNSYAIAAQLGGSPFGQRVRVMYTHHPDVERALRERHAGERDVFVQSFYDFGVDVRPFDARMDRLSVFMRIILMEDADAFAAYIARPPVAVYRHTVTDVDPFDPVRKGVGAWQVRSAAGADERADAGDEFTRLKIALTRELRTHVGLSTIPMLVRTHLHHIAYDSGWDCLATGVPCNVDNRDTNYIHGGCPDPSTGGRFVHGFRLSAQSLVLVVGTNHTFFDNAIYHSIQLYDDDTAQGIFSFQATREDRGNTSRSYYRSCERLWRFFLGTYPHATEKYYCALYSREPFEHWRLSEDMRRHYFQIYPEHVPLLHRIVFVERTYLQSPLSVSSDPDRLVFYDVQVHTANDASVLCI